jgi:hypothetical protein
LPRLEASSRLQCKCHERGALGRRHGKNLPRSRRRKPNARIAPDPIGHERLGLLASSASVPRQSERERSDEGCLAVSLSHGIAESGDAFVEPGGPPRYRDQTRLRRGRRPLFARE